MRALKWLGLRALAGSDVTGPSRHWMSNLANTEGNAAAEDRRWRLVEQIALVATWRSCTSVRLPRSWTIRSSPRPSAEDADEAPDRMRLPPVAFMISANVAPFARFISAMTSAFLLARSSVYWRRPCALAFFAGLAFFAALRLLSGVRPGRRLAWFSQSRLIRAHRFLLTGLRS